MTYGMTPLPGMPTQGYYMQNMSQMINQQLSGGAGALLASAQQEIASAMQMLQQRYQVDAMQMPYIAPSFVSGPPPWQMAYIPSPQIFQQTQAANPPGLTDPPADQNWPKGTTVTQGGMIAMPSAGGTVKIFNPGATGPNDSASLQFTVQNDKVYDKSGKQAFDLMQGGVLKLGDGSVVSSALDSTGQAHINIICNNAREAINFGTSGYNVATTQDGSSYLQSQLGTSSIQANTYGVATSSTGDVNFYKLQGGNILGKVTGSSWQVDPAKLTTVASSIIQAINVGVGQRFGFTLNPSDYTKLISGNDLGPMLQKLNLDINLKSGQTYNFSNILGDSKITSPKQLKTMMDNLAADMNINAPTATSPSDAEKLTKDRISTMVTQMQNIVGSNPVGEDWGNQQATVDPNDKNFLVTPPQFAPSQASQNYPNQLSQNLQALLASGQLPPQVAAYMSGGAGWQNQGPWANQFAGGLYNPQQSFSQQLAPLPTMWGAYNNYSSMMGQGLRGRSLYG